MPSRLESWESLAGSRDQETSIVSIVEENLRIVDDFVAAFNERDWDRVSSLHAESVVYWTPDNTEPLMGRDKVRQVFVGYTALFQTRITRRRGR